MTTNRLSLRHNFPDVARMYDRMGEDLGSKAMVRALNDTVSQGKTEMARQIAQEFRVTIAQAKFRLEVKKAVSRGQLRFQAVLSASNKQKGRSMNLIWFAERSVTLAAAAKRMRAGEGATRTLGNGAKVRNALQLRFQIKRGGGKKMIPGAFIGNKGRTVFIRTGKDRLPIKALNTIDIPQMFNTRKLNAIVRDVMQQRFAKNWSRQARAVMKGYIK